VLLADVCDWFGALKSIWALTAPSSRSTSMYAGDDDIAATTPPPLAPRSVKSPPTKRALVPLSWRNGL
jgi:hypothetical protein